MIRGIVGHQETVRHLSEIARDGRQAHAYLFVGPSGVGKSTVARAWAQELLNHEGKLAVHPDYHELDCTTLRADDVDPIDAARAVISFMATKPLLAVRKVVLIRHAEMLTGTAGDALLKTLEEPSGDRVMIITVTHADLIAPTIRSRCQMIAFEPVTAGIAPGTTQFEERVVALARVLQEMPSARLRWIAQQFGRAREAEEKRAIARELISVFERVTHDACVAGRGVGKGLVKALARTHHALANNVSPQMAIEQLILI